MKKGLTLIELLIVVSILAVLILMGWISWRNQINKARDAQRKDHLERISIAFEEYYDDNECFPDVDIDLTCNSSALEPYLYGIPCDPIAKTPYCYIHDPTTGNEDCGQSYKLLAPLANLTDPIITKLLCHGEENCGYDTTCQESTTNSNGFNYGVGSGNVPVLNPDYSPPPSPSPSPSPDSSPEPSHSPGQYGCESADINGCNNYTTQANAEIFCDITFSDNQCNNLCADPYYKCTR